VNTWKIVCATLVIFIAGIITGASLVRFAERGPKPWQRISRSGAHLPSPPESGHPNPPALSNNPRPAVTPTSVSPLLNREFVQILSRQLRLTPEQHKQIEKIMAEGQEHLRELRASLEPQTRQQLSETRAQISTLLTPEQREQFDRLMKQRASRRNDGSGQPDPERRGRDLRNPLPPREAPLGGEQNPPPTP